MARQATLVSGVAVVLQIVFAIVSTAITVSKLDQDGCYLNKQPGQVCDFVYATTGFSLLFSALLATGILAALRRGFDGFLPDVNGSLSFFAALWWLVTAITITQRGKQAGDAGLRGGSSRTAVIVLGWLEVVLFLMSGAAALYDRMSLQRHRILSGKAQAMLDSDVESQSSDPPPHHHHHHHQQQQHGYPAPHQQQHSYPTHQQFHVKLDTVTESH